MRRRLLAVPLVAAAALMTPPAGAASTALVIADPTGDANFSGLHGQSALPGSQAGFDIVTASFDTTKTFTTKVVKGKRVKVATPTGIQITLKMAGAPSTAPTSSYGITATHSLCGNLRLQIYYSESGPQTYGDLSQCGEGGGSTDTSTTRWSIAFTPKVSGNDMVIAIPFKLLPKSFKVGSLLDEIVAYTSTAEFVVAGYQPTDVEPSAGIDIATASKPWKVQ